MSNQVKGTSTNLVKLVNWDIDWYNGLSSEDDCLVWLSEQDRYALAQSLRQMKWSARWTSEIGTAQPDREAIAENLAFKLGGENCVDICALIQNCIDTTPAIQNQIIQIAQGGYVDGDSPPISEIEGSNILDDTVTCDNDSLFGAITGLVDLLNNIAMDLIEQISASANTTGRLGDLIEAIPGIGELPADDALQFLESFIEDLEQNYQASYTVALRDEYRCDLFCLAKGTCFLSFNEAFQYFLTRFTESISTLDWLDFIESFTQGTFAGVELVHAWHSFVMGSIAFGVSILNIDEQRMQQMVQALFNDPDPDWAILCAVCGAFTHNIDTNDQFVDFTLEIGEANSWRVGTVQAMGGRRSRLRTVTFPDRSIVSLRVFARFDDSASTRQIVATGYLDTVQVASRTITVGQSENYQWFDLMMPVNTYDEFVIELIATETGMIGFGGIQIIQISGTGSDPF